MHIKKMWKIERSRDRDVLRKEKSVLVKKKNVWKSEKVKYFYIYT